MMLDRTKKRGASAAIERADALRLPEWKSTDHDLIAEVPCAMVYDGSSVAVMMASPLDIEDFAVGFSLTEGYINNKNQIAEMEVVHHDEGIEARMWLSENRSEAFKARRRSMAGPVGCGMCGLETIEAAMREPGRVEAAPSQFSIDELIAATEKLRGHQPLHDQTRSVHGAGFILHGKGIVAAREDVGRHNALDKLIGAIVRKDFEAPDGAIVMTSRVSVELVQKAAKIGCPLLIAVSAPTTLALRTA
ncbi:MAG: formate dehydrogenase accessory sulfurtransferase FdhD, partial [Pseudomonadota bacterium]